MRKEKKVAIDKWLDERDLIWWLHDMNPIKDALKHHTVEVLNDDIQHMKIHGNLVYGQ